MRTHAWHTCATCRGDRVERARLVKAPNEKCFGVQIATNQISEGAAAAALAKEAGASFVDLNCGCPIYGARHGLCIACVAVVCT